MPLFLAFFASMNFMGEKMEGLLNQKSETKNTVSNSRRQLELTSLWLSFIPKVLE